MEARAGIQPMNEGLADSLVDGLMYLIVSDL